MGKKDGNNEKRRKEAEHKANQRKQVNASKSSERRKDIEPPKPMPRGALRVWQSLSLLWQAVIVLGVLSSAAAGVLMLRADVSIEPEFFLNDREPFSAYFPG